jgi:ParB-like chromosome segregation protein Spo0J
MNIADPRIAQCSNRAPAPVNQARTIAVLLHDLNVTATVLAKRLGRSRTDLAHTVRLLDLPDHAIELIDGGALTKGHGKALLTEPDHHRRRLLATRAAQEGWSIRALEAEIARGLNPRPKPPTPHPDHEAAAARLEEALAKATGCDARARPHRLGYQVILDQAAGERLIQFLDPEIPEAEEGVPRGTPASRAIRDSGLVAGSAPRRAKAGRTAPSG